MRKVVMSIAAGLLAASVITPAVAVGKPGGGTMPGQSAFGLCTTYFSGSQNGQDHKHQAPPFQDLEAKAAAANQSVADFCASQTPGGK
ncbi:MAG: hypothetical protein ACXVQW_13115 [Actinomycetota bacterium]